jgi:hypothetical protein
MVRRNIDVSLASQKAETCHINQLRDIFIHRQESGMPACGGRIRICE